MTTFTSKIGMMALLAMVVGCGNKNDSAPVTPATAPVETEITEHVPAPIENPAMAPSGNKIAASLVSHYDVTKGQSSTGEDGMTLEEILAVHPVLAVRADFLKTVTKVVETDAGTFDLYAGDVLAMTLGWNADHSALEVRSTSLVDFATDSIMLTTAIDAQSQETMAESMHFIFSDCIVEEQKQEQEQGKGKGEKEQKEIRHCSSIEANLALELIKEKQEQEQEKGGKGKK